MREEAEAIRQLRAQLDADTVVTENPLSAELATLDDCYFELVTSEVFSSQ